MIDIHKYDKNNIFSKILNKELPSTPIYEDDYVYAFEDINPQAPVHVLIIPKGKFCSLKDFSSKADDVTILKVFKSIDKIANELNLHEGYRVISNIGETGGQEVPHFHIHLLAGKRLGRLISV